MSAPEIDANELAANAAQFAGYQLTDAAGCVAVLLERPSASPVEIMEKHPVLVVGHALLAYLDARAEEQRILGETVIEALQEIAESTDMLCAVGGPMPGAALSEGEHGGTLPEGLRPEQMYNALKAEYERLNPDGSTEQHAAAMSRFAGLAGL